MFDKMIESQPQTDVQSRRSYFAVTAFGISLLSLSAVVVSIFADDFTLGSGAFELTELIAPVEMAAVMPEPKPRQAMPKTLQASKSEVPTRTDNVANIAETLDKVPPISTAPSTQMARPLDGRFDIGPINTNPEVTGGGPTRDSGSLGDGTTGIAAQTAAIVKDVEEEAPKAEKKVEPIKKPTQSGGVLNGKAVSLPLPAYPSTARAVNARGQVTVQVMLDETGRVISVSAVSGSPLLRASAEDAARRARFTPTFLSGVAVKVTGVIVYNFVG